MKNINIAYATDKKQYILTLVSIFSVLKNSSPQSFYKFHILNDNLCNKIKKSFKQVENKYKNCSIEFIQVDSNIFSDFPLSGWVTVPAWFRILLPDLLPEADKILYLDNDTIINNSIIEMYNTDLSEELLAGIEDCCKTQEKIRKLNMKSNIYINSGVLLINAKKWRENKIFDKIKDFAIKNKNWIEFSDQSCINKIIDENKIALSPKYNLMENEWRNYQVEYTGNTLKDFKKALENPTIIHYTGAKPNTPESGHKFKKLWWKYAKETKEFKKIKIQYFFKSVYKMKDYIFSIKNKYINDKKYKIITILGFSLKTQYK